MKMTLRNFTLMSIVVVLSNSVLAQDSTQLDLPKYNVKYAWEAPATAAMFVGAVIGFDKMKDKDRLSVSAINILNNDDVWKFDQISLRQDADYRFKAQNISDIGLNISLALPTLLALDKNIREEWLNLLFIYLETQAITNTFYVYGSAMWTKRIRPYVYYDEVPLEEKLEAGATDSFFSGHIANVAAASFFMAKVYTDFHPELGNKKWWVYSAALIPPAFVGIMRVKALKHFPTDLLVGTIVGAGLGILIPELHKVKERRNLQIIPIAGVFTGLHLSYKIKYN